MMETVFDKLMCEAGLTAQGSWDAMDSYDQEAILRFAELIVCECNQLNKEQSDELTGVVFDVESGAGFDAVCLNTVKRVETYLAGDTLLKHFRGEE